MKRNDQNPNTPKFRHVENLIKQGMSAKKAVETYNQTEQAWKEYITHPKSEWIRLDKPIW